jgi:hypothetical protein
MQERYLHINDFPALFTIAKVWKDPDAQKLVNQYGAPSLGNSPILRLYSHTLHFS